MNKLLCTDELFNYYERERHGEDKKVNNGANFNLLQDVFASTELFDLSLTEYTPDIGDNIITRDKDFGGITHEVFIPSLKNVALPFSACFVKKYHNIKGEYLCLFMREYSPTIITGCFWSSCSMQNHICGVSTPFYIHTDTGTLEYEHLYSETIKGFPRAYSRYDTDKIILDTLYTICHLPHHVVYADTPKNSSKYYAKIKATGIRVNNRPIYYVFNKKDSKSVVNKVNRRGSFELTHAFKVRGHWRRIPENKIGKNRNGEYRVYGYTWVTEYVKGNGELVKKLRVVN